MSFITCPNCGYVIVNSSEPCPSCGANVITSTPVSPPPPMVSTSSRDQYQYDGNDSKGSISIKMIAAILSSILILLAGSVGFYYHTTRSKTAKGLIKAFIDAGLQVNNIIEFDSRTDPNKQLGRPGQYVAKVTFYDSYETEMTIEVFTKKSDMEKRKVYIESVTGRVQFVSQYIYAHDLFLFRIDHQMLPENATKYGKVFLEYVEAGRIKQEKFARLEQERIASEQAKKEEKRIQEAKQEQERLAKRNRIWKTNTFDRITFKIDSSWKKELQDDGILRCYPDTLEETGYIQIQWTKASVGNLSGEEAISLLTNGINGMMGKANKST